MTLWAIWRSRNDMAFQGKAPSFKQFKSYVAQIEVENSIFLAKQIANRHSSSNQVTNLVCVHHLVTCRVDGSWAFGWVGGIGFLFKNGSNLMVYKSERVLACCALQAEAIALQQGIDYAISEGISECSFVTDNSTLATLCTNINPPI